VLTQLLSWRVLCARTDTGKDVEILLLRHQLAVLPVSSAQTPAASFTRSPTVPYQSRRRDLATGRLLEGNPADGGCHWL
jgi:hypothetical protein